MEYGNYAQGISIGEFPTTRQQAQRRLEKRVLKALSRLRNELGNSRALLLGEPYIFELRYPLYLVVRFLDSFSLMRCLKGSLDKPILRAFEETEELAYDFPGSPCLVFSRPYSPILICLRAGVISDATSVLRVSDYEIRSFSVLLPERSDGSLLLEGVL